ncbi:MAG TPA: hypothetical protein VE650_07090 [Acetobacteraceae bacterium]|nr:hypothetical protein [Acetobacteraceae bacterium]
MPDVSLLLPEIDRMSAAELDALLEAVIARRAMVKPAPSGDPAQMRCADNLLWHVRPAPTGRGCELGLFHPGLGWIAVTLSRAQIEDMQDAFAFALAALPVHVNPAA